MTSELVWLVEHEDGLRRSWLRDVTDDEVAEVRETLEQVWAPGQTTARSMSLADVPDEAVRIHQREAEIRGLAVEVRKAVP